LTNAIDELIRARAYRGKRDGRTAAAVLNTTMKYVGLEPSGPDFSAVGDLARHVPIIEEAMAQGFTEVDLYIHGREFVLVDYFKNKGVTLNVFTTAMNSPFVTRDFYTDGPHRNMANVFMIVDYLPAAQSDKGVEPLILEWNAHAAVLDKVGIHKIGNIALFHRLSLQKLSSSAKNPTYGIADIKMADQLKHWPVIGVGFKGVRHHNGEFVLYCLDGKDRVPVGKEESKINFVELKTETQRQVFVGQLARIVASRVHIANQARTFAIPCGRWMFDVLPVPLPDGRSVNADLAFEKLIALRMSDTVKSSRAEIVTISRANEFGEGVKIGDAPSPDFLALLKGPRKIAAAAPPAPAPEGEGKKGGGDALKEAV